MKISSQVRDDFRSLQGGATRTEAEWAGQGARFALAGIVVGSLLALAGSQWVQPLLFEQSARDPLVFAIVGVVMLLVALAACASPAKRAASADPNAALRSE